MKPKAYSYIRFSTLEQEKGDSLRRQIALSEEYAREHNLVLDNSLQLTDRGLSAYKGFHRTRGALGEFLQLVEQGKIPRGSLLLVENMDRLSREQVSDALAQFLNIIKAGIRLVTLQDGMEYDRESIDQNWTQLIISITYMARAHEESKVKSKRGKSVWKEKRLHAKEKKLTVNCPSWLKPKDKPKSEDESAFEVIPEAAQVINQIFDMKLEGKGAELIAKELNKSEVWKPPTHNGGSSGWQKSYITKLLHGDGKGIQGDRRLIGEQQFYTIGKNDENGKSKRIPDGDPVPGYYPAIIDMDKFDRVQAQIIQNRSIRGMAAGRTGNVNNLFTYLLECGKCGGGIAYLNKGKSPQGKYLQCSRAKINLGCKYSEYVRYEEFEDKVLTFCKGLNVADIISDSKKQLNQLAELQHRQQSIDGELNEVESRKQNLVSAIEQGKLNPSFLERLNHRDRALGAEQMKLSKEKRLIQDEIFKLTHNEKENEERLKNTRELIERMKNLKGEKRIELRLHLKTQLRKLIRKIRVLPDDGTIVLFFHTGERRGIFPADQGTDWGKRIGDSRIVDAFPRSTK